MKYKFELSFKPVEEKYRELIHKWLFQPYVSEWFYGEGLDNTLNHLDEFIRGSSNSQYWLAFDDNTPFAFLITSYVNKPVDELSRWCTEEGITITLDMLI